MIATTKSRRRLSNVHRGWPFIAAALPVYQLYGGTPRLGQYNHRQGHAVPPQALARIEEWFAAYL